MGKRNRPKNQKSMMLSEMQKQHNIEQFQSNKKSTVDIIIPVYGKFDLLQQCIDAIPLAIDQLTYQVYIFDNNSPGDSPEQVDQFYYDLKHASKVDPSLIHILRNKTNYGFPTACNRAAVRGNSDLIFLLNSDCIMLPGSLIKLIQMLQADPQAGVAAPMLIFPPQTEMVKSGMTNEQVLIARPAGKVQHIGLDTNINGEIIHSLVGWSPGNFKVMRVSSAYAATGAALLTRRFLWNKIGGFWEGYGLGTYEDVDYCLTVRSLGYNIRIVPSAVGVHFVGASAITYNQQYPFNENRVKFLQRWGNKLQYTEWERW